MTQSCSDENCHWRKLAEELLEDNRELMEDQRQYTLFLEAQVAEGALRHGDVGPALAYLATADPHDYLDLPGV